MKPSIAIFIEGGGDCEERKAQLRLGFDALLRKQKDAASVRKLGWRVTMCGPRRAAYDKFMAAVANGGVIPVLLVDAEGPVAEIDDAARTAHLARRDGWDLSPILAERVHLMVQCMEAWIVADPDAVATFYGQHFLRNRMPARQNLEEEPKQTLHDSLAHATRHTQKGEYQKIKHARHLLARIDPVRVGSRCPAFSAFTNWLDRAIAGA